MKGIRPGNNVISVSSYAAENENLTHTHKPESTVGHCPCFSTTFKKAKAKTGRIFLTSILGFLIQRNAGYRVEKHTFPQVARGVGGCGCAGLLASLLY